MKSDQATVQQRVEEILKLKLQGAQFYDIRQHASEKGWNVSERQLRRYMQQADDLLAQSLERDRDKLLDRHHATRRVLLARALQADDVRTALAVAKDEAELLGLYPAKQHQLSGTGGGPIVLNIVEEVVGDKPPAALENIVEEVVTHDDRHATGVPAADRNPDGPPASGAA